MRLGLFGGSFDPVHHGHLQVAACCQDQARLDQVWFVPAALQPLKQQGPQAADAERIEMLRLATKDLPWASISSIEIDRGGVSYTVETLRTVRQLRPTDDLFFMMGADTIADLSAWREPEEVLRLATPLVVGRPDQTNIVVQVEHIRIEMPPVEISSSTIRDRVQAGDTIEDLVPSAVAEYIAIQKLYR